jgi:putative ABC transport system substrate-binding protein
LLAFLAGPVQAQERPQVVVVRTQKARPYQAALEGLRAGLEPRAALHFEIVDREDPDEGARIMAGEPDVLVTVGSQATSWSIHNTRDVPIVFTMVLNPVSSGLVPSMRRPGGRVTGASLDVPPDAHFRALRELIGARRIAVLYNPEETGPVIESARQAALRQEVELVPIGVPSPKQLNQALGRVDSSYDALWSVADRTILSHGTVEHVLIHTIRAGIPFMGLSEPYVRAGALLALSTSYHQNGRQAAGLVRRILGGESPGDLAITIPTDLEVVFNELTAKRIGVTLPSQGTLPMRAVSQ